jgi:hypothetical protein
VYGWCDCRAALVLVSASQLFADVLEAEGGKHDDDDKDIARHPRAVALSAACEARYAVKFLEQALFTGKDDPSTYVYLMHF